MKKKVIILILILSSIFVLTGCKKGEISAVTEIYAPVKEDFSEEKVEQTPYVITAKTDGLNKYDLFCNDGDICEEDSWFWGRSPVKGVQQEAVKILQDFAAIDVKNMTKDSGTKEEIMEKYNLGPGTIRAVLYDLNGDGEPEVIGRCYTSYGTGSMAESFFILQKDGDSYKDISDFVTHRARKFQIIKATSNREYCCIRVKYDESNERFFCYNEGAKKYEYYTPPEIIIKNAGEKL